MAENPYDRTDVLRRDAWDAGFAAGIAAERERCAGLADARAGGEPRMDGSTVYRNPAMVKLAAAIRAGEVRG